MCGLLFLLFILFNNLQADTVIFKNGKRLECKVVPPEENTGNIRLILDEKENSSVVVAVDSIAKIDYDYESMLAALSEDEFVKHYELGVWCIKRQLFKEAIERFLHCHGEGRVPPEIEYYLGQAYENLETPRYLSARDNYKNYLNAGTDKNLKERCLKDLARIEKVIKDKNLAEKGEAGLSAIGDGLESASWAAPGWGYMSNISRPQIEGKKNNNTALEVKYLKRDARGKVLPVNDRKAPVQLRLEKDLAETPVLSLDVYNPEKFDIAFTATVTTGAGYEWFESPMIKVPAGKWLTGIKIDLKKKNWKCKKSNWQNTSSVENIAKTRALIFLIYNGNRAGKIYFDSVEFKSK
jgi:hypothetical protein